MTNDGAAGEESAALNAARQAVNTLEITLFFTALLLIAEGWGIVYPRLVSGTRILVITAALAYLLSSYLTTWVCVCPRAEVILFATLTAPFVVAGGPLARSTATLSVSSPSCWSLW